jgi:hypothetical protein
MDINLILKTKPHNPHYLNRYIKFILSLQNQSLENCYYENHHICPKAKDLFPEYCDLKKHTWNKIKLTFRQHIIAHYMLMKAYNTQSQILAVIRTAGQYHNNIPYKSRLIEIAKINLSNKRKGVFSRGYNEDGTPNVSEKTRKKISALKKQFYSNPENRKKQSLACKGTTGRKSEKYSIAAKLRTKEHLEKISKSIRKYNASLTANQRKKILLGIYVTPIGNFSRIPKLGNYCLSCDKIITIHSCKFSNSFFPHSVIGMTPKELGFYFIPKNSPELKEYCVDLNQAHPPEPNHPLASELNDYLLREKLLP